MEKKKSLKMLTTMLIISVFCAFVIPSFMLDSQAYAASKTHLSKTSINLDTGDSQKISLILPSGKKVSASKVTWKTSSSKVASVKKGKITGKSEGNCTITAKYKGKKYKCKVNVKINYAKNSPEENLQILADKVQSAGGSLVLNESTVDNNVLISYSPVYQDITFRYETKSSRTKLTLSATYHTDTQKWSTISFSLSDGLSAQLHTSENFDPSTYYYYRDLNYTYDATDTQSLNSAQKEIIKEMAAVATNALWGGVSDIMVQNTDMKLRYIGFDNF